MNFFRFIRWHKIPVVLLLICITATLILLIHLQGSITDTDNTFFILKSRIFASLTEDREEVNPSLDSFLLSIPLIGIIILLYLISSADPVCQRKKGTNNSISGAITDSGKKTCFPSKEENPTLPCSLTETLIMGGKVIGHSHIRQGKPCQDAYFYTKHNSGIVLAVADGLGSASRSETGSDIAAATAVVSIREALEKQADKKKPDYPAIIKEGFSAARHKLEKNSRQGNYHLKDLATTLIVVISDGERITSGQIGDGGVVARDGEGYRLISAPEKQEYWNETVSVTSGIAPDPLIINDYHGDIREIILFTDGCQRAALLRKGDYYSPYLPFFLPLSYYLTMAESEEFGNQMIMELLESDKMLSTSEDDKTFLIAIIKKRESS